MRSTTHHSKVLFSMSVTAMVLKSPTPGGVRASPLTRALEDRSTTAATASSASAPNTAPTTTPVTAPVLSSEEGEEPMSWGGAGPPAAGAAAGPAAWPGGGGALQDRPMRLSPAQYVSAVSRGDSEAEMALKVARTLSTAAAVVRLPLAMPVLTSDRAALRGGCSGTVLIWPRSLAQAAW